MATIINNPTIVTQNLQINVLSISVTSPDQGNSSIDQKTASTDQRISATSTPAFDSISDASVETPPRRRSLSDDYVIRPPRRRVDCRFSTIMKIICAVACAALLGIGIGIGVSIDADNRDAACRNSYKNYPSGSVICKGLFRTYCCEQPGYFNPTECTNDCK